MTRLDIIEDFLAWVASQRYKGYDNKNNMLLVGRHYKWESAIEVYKWESAIEVYKNEVLLKKENKQ